MNISPNLATKILTYMQAYAKDHMAEFNPLAPLEENHKYFQQLATLTLRAVGFNQERTHTGMTLWVFVKGDENHPGNPDWECVLPSISTTLEMLPGSHVLIDQELDAWDPVVLMHLVYPYDEHKVVAIGLTVDTLEELERVKEIVGRKLAPHTETPDSIEKSKEST